MGQHQTEGVGIRMTGQDAMGQHTYGPSFATAHSTHDLVSLPLPHGLSTPGMPMRRPSAWCQGSATSASPCRRTVLSRRRPSDRRDEGGHPHVDRSRPRRTHRENGAASSNRYRKDGALRSKEANAHPQDSQGPPRRTQSRYASHRQPGFEARRARPSSSTSLIHRRNPCPERTTQAART